MSKLVRKVIGSLATVTLLSALMAAQAVSSGRYDSSIQEKVTQQLSSKKQFQNVQASVEDGIVTLRGTVGLFQDKLAAAKSFSTSRLSIFCRPCIVERYFSVRSESNRFTCYLERSVTPAHGLLSILQPHPFSG